MGSKEKKVGLVVIFIVLGILFLHSSRSKGAEFPREWVTKREHHPQGIIVIEHAIASKDEKVLCLVRHSESASGVRGDTIFLTAGEMREGYTIWQRGVVKVINQREVSPKNYAIEVTHYMENTAINIDAVVDPSDRDFFKKTCGGVIGRLPTPFNVILPKIFGIGFI